MTGNAAKTIRTIWWEGEIDGVVRLIEQTLLPGTLLEIDVSTQEDMWDAIHRLAVRGAPAIGVAAAFGFVLGIRNSSATDWSGFQSDIKKTADYLATARPTAVNLFWALNRMQKVAEEHASLSVPDLKQRLFKESLHICEEDRQICRELGRHGATLIETGQSALTHCNAGGLATADYGTALAVFFTAHEQGKTIHVFADETRPLNQGSRLTSWELIQRGIDVTLICDSMAGQVMKEGRVDKVFVGADRIAGNGDACNKIGTYSVSVLAKAHDIPFYVVAPTSTFDLSLSDGSQIPIEERDPDEIRQMSAGPNAPPGVAVYNPAFDVTPHENISGIVTEFGVIDHPDQESVQKHFTENGCLAE